MIAQAPSDVPAHKMYPHMSPEGYPEYQRQQAMFHVAQLLNNPYFKTLMGKFNKGQPNIITTIAQGIKERFGGALGSSDSLLCDEIRSYIVFFFMLITVYLLASLLLTYMSKKR